MIEIKNLTKFYGNNAAVKNISFTVKDNEILGFLGPNGAGKSTTMNILTGFLPSTSGKVLIGDIDIAEKPSAAKKKIGYLPEIPPVYPDMRVKEYLKFCAGIKGVKRSERKAQVEDAMEKLHIKDMENRLIRNLSKGYKQRVGFAQALIGNPPVLILDEPTVGLDPNQIIEIRTLIKMLGKHHTVILSSHILSEIEAVCDRIVIIDHGKIVANDKAADLSAKVSQDRRMIVSVAGPAKEVANLISGINGVEEVSYEGSHEVGVHDFAIETVSGADIRRDLFTRLAQRNWPLLASGSRAMSLEDVFINLTIKANGGKL